MPRPSNTSSRRTQIVEGLKKVMATDGYEGATIMSIAKAAGLTAGLIHYHFKSKQEILLALVQSITNEVHSSRSLTESSNPFTDLDNFVDAHLALKSESSQMTLNCWIVIGAEAVKQPEVRQVYQQAARLQIELAESIIERCLSQNSKSTVAKRSLALGLHAAIEGAYRLLISAPELLEKGFAAKTVQAMIHGAISAQPNK